MNVQKSTSSCKSNPKPIKSGKNKIKGSRVIVREPDQKSLTLYPSNFDGESNPLESVSEGTEISVVELPDWPDDSRKHLLHALAKLDQPHTLNGGNGSANYKDLFEFTLAVMETDNVERCGRSINATLEAAAFKFGKSDNLRIACGKIVLQLKTLGIPGYRTEEIQRRAMALANGLPDASEPVYVTAVLPEAPVDEDVVVPPGWMLSQHGISRNGASPINAPIVICGRTKEEASGEQSLVLAMLHDGNWQQRTVARKIIANQNSILELAGYGLPVNSNNARDVVSYLADFETANREKLPVATTTQRLGWHGKNRFLCGISLITSKGIGDSIDLSVLPPMEWPTQTLALQSRDGQDQLAGGFHARGKLEEWLKAISCLEHCPKAQLGLYASFVPPLMGVLQIENFTVEFAGPSSRGKTTVLRLAASVWGNPDERSGSTATLTWDVTRVFLERAAAARNNLPLIVDDTKRAKRPEEVTQLLYDVAAGRGRGRGSIRGTAHTVTYQTVMLMSGESPACSFKQDGGSFARVLSVWGSPFDSADSDVAAIVTGLNTRVLHRYGLAGPAFVLFLLQNKSKWKTWRKEFGQIVQGYEQLAGGNAVAHRVAKYGAAIEMAGRLVHKALKMPWRYNDPVKKLWSQLIQEANGVDRAAAALQHVMSWANSHEAEFVGRRDIKLPPPNAGWAGRWDKPDCVPSGRDSSRKKGTEQENGAIMFFPHKLEEILRDGGFDPESIRRTWKDNGWLRVTEEKGKTQRSQCRTRIDGKCVWLVAIRLSAVKQAQRGSEADANA